MSNTTPAKHHRARRCATAFAVVLAMAISASNVAQAQETRPMNPTQTSASETLSARQQAIVPVAAFAAAGDMAQLNAALNQGLDAGMTVSDAKEILEQHYAYASLPRSLNALSAAGRRHRQPDQAVGRAGRRAAVRLRAHRERVPAHTPVR